MEWLAGIYVLFELCVISPDGKNMIDDAKERPIWVRHDAVSSITRPRVSDPETMVGPQCTAIEAGGSRFFVVGSPQEIYKKLTEHYRN